MENDTALIPSSLKMLISEYVASFLFVLKNKWLYLIVLFFSLLGSFYSLGMQLYYKFVFPDLYRNQSVFENIFSKTSQPFSERITTALTSIQLGNTISSLSFTAIFSMVGMVVAFFIFYRYFKKIFSSSLFVKKCCRLSLFGLALGAVISVVSFFFFKNLIIIFLGILIALVGLQILFIVLLTILEGTLVFFIKSLLFNQQTSAELLFSKAEEIFKPLFLFNTILTFASPTFLVSVMLLPDMLSTFVFNEIGNFSRSIPQNLYVGVFSIIKYFHAFFVASFVFVPFLLTMNSAKTLPQVLHENIYIIRKNFLRYLSFVISGVLILILLAVIFELFTPSAVTLSVFSAIKEIMYGLIFTLLILVFSITAYKFAVQFSRAQGSNF